VTKVVATVHQTVSAVLKPLDRTVADLRLPGLSTRVEARPVPPILGQLAPITRALPGAQGRHPRGRPADRGACRLDRSPGACPARGGGPSGGRDPDSQ